MARINSRQKGKRGELSFVAFLKEKMGAKARRGLQYSGSADSPDVVSDLPFYFEVKLREKLNIYEAMDKAVEDSNGSSKTPVIAWRKNRRDWLIILRAEDFAKIWLESNKVEVKTDGINRA